MKTICPPGYYHKDFVTTRVLGHMIYGYTLLVLINQRVLNKLNKDLNRSDINDRRHTECTNLTEARYAKYMCNHENNASSLLSPQWLWGNSSAWAHDVRLHIVGINE